MYTTRKVIRSAIIHARSAKILEIALVKIDWYKAKSLRLRIVNCTLTGKTTSCHTAVTFVRRIDINISCNWEIMVIINSVCLVSVHNSSIMLYPGFSWVQIQITTISPLYKYVSPMTLWISLDHFAHEWKHKGKCKAHRLWSFGHLSTKLF